MKNGPYELMIAPKDYPGKKYRGRYCYEHILVWWENTGKVPAVNELIHHINGQKRDNRIENLALMAVSTHNKLHHVRAEPNAVCSNCLKDFRVGPWKLKRSYNFCSKRCVGLFGFPSRYKKIKKAYYHLSDHQSQN